MQVQAWITLESSWFANVFDLFPYQPKANLRQDYRKMLIKKIFFDNGSFLVIMTFILSQKPLSTDGRSLGKSREWKLRKIKNIGQPLGKAYRKLTKSGHICLPLFTSVCRNNRRAFFVAFNFWL